MEIKNMKGIGKLVNMKEKEYFIMKMVIYIKEIGKIVKKKEKE